MAFNFNAPHFDAGYADGGFTKPHVSPPYERINSAAPLTQSLTFSGFAAAILTAAGILVGSLGFSGAAPLAAVGPAAKPTTASIAFTGSKPAEAFTGPATGAVAFASSPP